MGKRKRIRPDWSETPPPKGSYRSIFKYGDPGKFKHPGDQWYAMLKDELGMTDNDFRTKGHEGRDPVVLKRPCGLSSGQIERITEIVGPANVATDE